MQKAILLICLLTGAMMAAEKSQAQAGCNDPYATNYNAAATSNDGSCIYAATSITPVVADTLSDTLRETSGMVYWNGWLWTHNDDTDPHLYAIDTTDGHIVKKVEILNVVNTDWEEISQDNDYFYLGDFGNNGNGNRQDLNILRIAKTALTGSQGTVTADKILFSYQDQTSFTPAGNNNTDFDCEAFIAGTDSLYLFTKQWVSHKTKIYALPKVPGTYSAVPKAEYNVGGLVTGATYIPGKKTVVLSGYSTFVQPFVCLLYDYQDNRFFSGNKRKITMSLPLHQTEAIATCNGLNFFLTNEAFAGVPPKLLKISLEPYLARYYQSLGVGNVLPGGAVSLYPNPATDAFVLNIRSPKEQPLTVTLINSAGQLIHTQTCQLAVGVQELRIVPPAGLATGVYWLEVATTNGSTVMKALYQ